MNRIRALLDKEIPLVAVSFRDTDSRKLAEKALTAGVDVAELRIDQYSNMATERVLEEIQTFSALPVLATIRSQNEGGGWNGSEAARLALFQDIIPEVDAVDIELSSSHILPDVVAAAKASDCVVLVSYHDFERTPALGALEATVKEAKDAGADIVKISTMAQSRRDVQTLASLTLTMADVGLIIIAMGPVGTIGRVLFPALGSRLTFSYIGDQSAPGQLSFDETYQLMRKFYPEFN